MVLSRFPTVLSACVILVATSMTALAARTPPHPAGAAHALKAAARTASGRVAPEPTRFARFHDAGMPATPRIAPRPSSRQAPKATSARAAVSEQAERDARAQRLYRSSQTSAPIIRNARACKRIGAHGESIYENC